MEECRMKPNREPGQISFLRYLYMNSLTSILKIKFVRI
jgi:hypothetical protein